MDAENQKAESGREHQKRATLFNAAEQKVATCYVLIAFVYYISCVQDNECFKSSLFQFSYKFSFVVFFN